MLIIRNNESVWCKFTYRGKTFKLKIKPADAEKVEELRDAHTQYELMPNPANPVLPYKMPKFDERGFLNDLADHLIDEFQDVMESKTKAMPCTRENKVKVAFLKRGPDDTESLWNQIMMKANELQIIEENENKESEGN